MAAVVVATYKNGFQSAPVHFSIDSVARGFARMHEIRNDVQKVECVTVEDSLYSKLD